MEDIFISNIHINKVRHLENVDILLSETERKHLILTGKNGSGKTSVLESLKDFFFVASDKENDIFTKQHEVKVRTNASLRLAVMQKLQANRLDEIISFVENNKYNDVLKKVFLKLNANKDEFYKSFQNNKFIISHFSAKRTLSEFNLPSGITKINDTNNLNIVERQNKFFIQHLVNLQADIAFAQTHFEKKQALEISNWFDNFENSLKQLFNDPSLTLFFDKREYNFLIKLDNRPLCKFTELSDGYSAIIDIISELIMRMSKSTNRLFNLQGIVLIDEIETHLHIDLQKKILPFLTSFFPKIQFIVTTHSPFVLSSVDNAVIFDLETKQRVEDLSGYSVEGIVESYFDIDQYSDEIKAKLDEYETLLNKSNLTSEEKERKLDLKIYFKDNIAKTLSPELSLRIKELETQKLVIQ